MIKVKQKLVTLATTLVLGCGFTFGITPASAASNENTTDLISTSSFEKLQQIHFTGYVVSVDSNYMTIVDTPTMEKAQMYQENWWNLVNENKILLVPVLDNNSYTIGDKLDVYFEAMTMSLPPIAMSPIVEKVAE
ncbi:TPA: DUF3221 domain-containing protein [Bacillus thuringiensis]|uniref:DUF3221 domain-containing protein n=1 Tax=Bacillus thuringiensis TaxID=1428 RepID=A0A9X6KIG2_BACTU|nr:MULTISPECIES: DUF3221 domain-containing protein [Bacillus cereus group]AJA23092.1 hypothetical protein BT4G5_30105 [Bacillus thuringiensis serovar galleriae]ETE91933.1 hypothetical protein C621_0216390 [Bacillus thuringiensis serovar aizawai str. Leapi01]ETE93636.1 hypothetical protein C623_0225195 [Bacillus thuringiensis serovar aizawai str. Hu4-2]KAB1378832.1 DUF3221 domain-containing protein [Bacillus thuringiensis]KLA35827.1 hypothetical protein B4158_5908 [Bacillus cereus]